MCRWIAILLLAVCVLPTAVVADHAKFPVEHGFLSMAYDDMEIVERDKGFDLVYIAPGAFEAIGNYEAIMIDQPEVWIDRKSDYPGSKPDYMKALADLVRDMLVGALVRGGHDVVEAAGPNVAFMRIALTDLYLKKKKGKASVGYTSIGSASPGELIESMLENFDIIEVSLQLEVVDLETEELLGAVVVRRGERIGTHGTSEGRLDFSEFFGIVELYASRIRCRFDNGRLPKEEWADCVQLIP